MGEVMKQLQSFLPVASYNIKSDYDENYFEIIDARTDEEIGHYCLNRNGELVSFTLLEDTKSGNLLKTEILDIAERIINCFFPGQKEYELSAIIDLDNPFMVIYEKRDEKYGLFLHSTGFKVSVSTAGQITGFYWEDEEFEVRYSDVLITEEVALETYVKGLDFELNIQNFNQEVYKNGDNQYHLAYSIIEQVTDIPVDGSESSSIREEHNIEPKIQELKVNGKSLYETIGITSEYKLLDKIVEEGKRIELWSGNELVDSFSFEMDEPEKHVIKLCFDDRTGLLLQISSGEEYESEGEEIGLESARKQSLELMFKCYPDTHERFRLEALEEEECEDNEEDFAEESYEEELELDEFDDEYVEEPTYTFYFHYFHKGIRVDQHVSHIGVGKYTGKIRYFQLDIPFENQLNKLTSTSVISLQEAIEIYKKAVQMELLFVREYDENGKSIYALSYAPAFPTTVGHVRAIDAVTGKLMYVDVGDAMFWN